MKINTMYVTRVCWMSERGIGNMKRRKEHLIPIEKRRKVIYLERRGPESKKLFWPILCGIIGIACFLYCLSIALFMGYGTKFFLIWGVIAVFFGMLSLLLLQQKWVKKIPKWIKVIFLILLTIGCLFFATIEGFIFSEFSAKAKPGADYVIVLGAQWKPSGPSYVLQKRLEKAIEYLNQNPETKVIVSGGQGANEPISEAEGMATYIEQAGIAKERIVQEDQSTNTDENLKFSGELVNKENDKVVLVTNNFHMFRALHIAQKQGYAHIEGLSAKSYPAMVPNNLLREFFGVVKDFLVGNL